jgi:hypothetical protein
MSTAWRRRILADEEATVMVTSGIVLDETKIEGFRASLRGRLVRPGDDDYDEARKVWNGNIDRPSA